MHHSPLRIICAASLLTTKERDMLHRKKKRSTELRVGSKEATHQRFTVTVCPALTNLPTVRKPHIPKKFAVLLIGTYSTSMLKEQPIFFHTSTLCSSLYWGVSKDHEHCGTFKSLCHVSVACLEGRPCTENEDSYALKFSELATFRFGFMCLVPFSNNYTHKINL